MFVLYESVDSNWFSAGNSKKQLKYVWKHTFFTLEHQYINVYNLIINSNGFF